MRSIQITLAIGLLSCLAAGQVRPQPATPDYWIKQLELPARRDLAMERLVALGPKAVESLVRCLADPRPEIRVFAIRTLGFLGEDGKPALSRILAVESGTDAKLALAVQSAADAIRGGRGFLLVFDFADGKLIEMDGRGKERLMLGDLPELRSGRLLASGNYLVATKIGVRELATSGATVWSYPEVVASDVERLVSGNTLIASAATHRVFEVDAAGKELWGYKDKSREFRPVSCQRLVNGHTLIADYSLQDVDDGRVFEVDRNKQIVWKLTWKQPSSARRLTGGRTLIVSHKPGRVQIVDRLGKVLQSFTDVGIPSVAEYLPNGHLLVGGEGYLRELDANGVRLWNHPSRWISGMQRH
ncbi:MAG: hypothetical protein ACI85K_000406 [Hyphomicrobiaceae bacterium]|jgi:hypothetical protein